MKTILSINGVPSHVIYFRMQMAKETLPAKTTINTDPESPHDGIVFTPKKRGKKQKYGLYRGVWEGSPRGNKKREIRELTQNAVRAQQALEKAFAAKGVSWRDLEVHMRTMKWSFETDMHKAAKMFGVVDAANANFEEATKKSDYIEFEKGAAA